MPRPAIVLPIAFQVDFQKHGTQHRAMRVEDA